MPADASQPDPARAEGQDAASATSHSPETRRGFFEIGSVIIGAILGLGPFLIGLVAFLSPLTRERKVPEKYRQPGTGKAGYLRVAAIEALTVGAAPQRFPVIDNQIDAWNFTPGQPVGAVYIERMGPTELRVFNVTCPHAGCSVSCHGTAYHCPCHNSSFELDGSKLVSSSGRENPSPRNLDDLNYEVTNGDIWVEFKNFYTGKHEKIAKS